jgi:hypothetical protein
MIRVMSTADIVGWVATGVVVGSYMFKDQVALRRMQALSAVLWMSYGLLIHSSPVIVANIIVFVAAAFSSIVAARRGAQPELE